ncbi:MAG: hypothetical protein CMB73_04105 [Euryarchaeota archaeon]|nr:hypothetical protein [Euryarchaeota archaeon]MEC8736568.1 NADH-quinone oxidoreductase subunit J [Candidatus Thermoplasmatota archaeon]|tara:strand:- start:1073 stop:1351 length:279 start_codon:yes stop_codon:yes gene_type:complete
MVDINMIAENVIFFIFATVAIGGAFFLIKAPKVAHSMVALIFCFTAIAGVFILVGAEFLASIQILVYLASVGLVVLFAIMLTQRQILEEDFE